MAIWADNKTSWVYLISLEKTAFGKTGTVIWRHGGPSYKITGLSGREWRWKCRESITSGGGMKEDFWGAGGQSWTQATAPQAGHRAL